MGTHRGRKTRNRSTEYKPYAKPAPIGMDFVMDLSQSKSCSKFWIFVCGLYSVDLLQVFPCKRTLKLVTYSCQFLLILALAGSL